MKYSKSFRTFFTSDNPMQPDDLINVSDSDRTAALNRLPGETLDVVGGQLVVIPVPVMTAEQLLINAKAGKTNEIKAACDAAIIAGINSSALGQAHSYPTGRDDQLNLNGLVTESLLSGSGDAYKFWCADVNGVWERRVHTKSQIQTVGKAVANHVKEQQEKYEQKLSEIAVASIQTALNAVLWG